jgi:hypothetical protein
MRSGRAQITRPHAEFRNILVTLILLYEMLTAFNYAHYSKVTPCLLTMSFLNGSCYCPSLGYAKMYQTFSTASTTLRMYFNFYIVVEKCIFYGMVILVFLFLNSVEVQQTSKFARTSATFCHMASRRLSVCGPPSNCLSK